MCDCFFRRSRSGEPEPCQIEPARLVIDARGADDGRSPAAPLTPSHSSGFAAEGPGADPIANAVNSAALATRSQTSRTSRSVISRIRKQRRMSLRSTPARPGGGVEPVRRPDARPQRALIIAPRGTMPGRGGEAGCRFFTCSFSPDTEAPQRKRVRQSAVSLNRLPFPGRRHNDQAVDEFVVDSTACIQQYARGQVGVRPVTGLVVPLSRDLPGEALKT